jgi:hypothetical protein
MILEELKREFENKLIRVTSIADLAELKTIFKSAGFDTTSVTATKPLDSVVVMPIFTCKKLLSRSINDVIEHDFARYEFIVYKGKTFHFGAN